MKPGEPLKVLFSHYGILDGAGFSRSFLIAKGLADIGHKVTLITGQSAGFTFPYIKDVTGNLSIISFPDFSPISFRQAGLGILNIILKSLYATVNRFDIVHSDSGHRPSSGLPCIINRWIYKSKYISEWWDYFGKGGLYDQMPKLRRFFLGNYDNWSEIYNKKIADGVIALSEFTRQRAIQAGIKDKKIIIVHGGSDIENIEHYIDTKRRGNFGIDPDCFLFGFIGIDEAEFNDLEPFVKAMQCIKKTQNVKWFTTGSKLKRETLLRFNINDDLYEFGWIDYSNYSDLISCADIFLLFLQPNLQNEARFPNKLGDYLAAGRLILTNGFGEINSYITNYPESFINVNWNSQDIQRAIIELLDQKKNILINGGKSRDIAEKFNSWNLKALEVEKFYYRILNT